MSNTVEHQIICYITFLHLMWRRLKLRPFLNRGDPPLYSGVIIMVLASIVVKKNTSKVGNIIKIILVFFLWTDVWIYIQASLYLFYFEWIYELPTDQTSQPLKQSSNKKYQPIFIIVYIVKTWKITWCSENAWDVQFMKMSCSECCMFYSILAISV